jgi:hypothetical protein
MTSLDEVSHLSEESHSVSEGKEFCQGRLVVLHYLECVAVAGKRLLVMLVKIIGNRWHCVELPNPTGQYLADFYDGFHLKGRKRAIVKKSW